MEGSPLKVILPVDTPPAKDALRENMEVKTRIDEWLTSAQNKEEAENKPYKGDEFDKEDKEQRNVLLPSFDNLKISKPAKAVQVQTGVEVAHDLVNLDVAEPRKVDKDKVNKRIPGLQLTNEEARMSDIDIEKIRLKERLVDENSGLRTRALEKVKKELRSILIPHKNGLPLLGVEAEYREMVSQDLKRENILISLSARILFASLKFFTKIVFLL